MDNCGLIQKSSGQDMWYALILYTSFVFQHKQAHPRRDYENDMFQLYQHLYDSGVFMRLLDAVISYSMCVRKDDFSNTEQRAQSSVVQFALKTFRLRSGYPSTVYSALLPASARISTSLQAFTVQSAMQGALAQSTNQKSDCYVDDDGVTYRGSESPPWKMLALQAPLLRIEVTRFQHGAATQPKEESEDARVLKTCATHFFSSRYQFGDDGKTWIVPIAFTTPERTYMSREYAILEVIQRMMSSDPVYTRDSFETVVIQLIPPPLDHEQKFSKIDLRNDEGDEQNPKHFCHMHKNCDVLRYNGMKYYRVCPECAYEVILQGNCCRATTAGRKKSSQLAFILGDLHLEESVFDDTFSCFYKHLYRTSTSNLSCGGGALRDILWARLNGEELFAHHIRAALQFVHVVCSKTRRLNMSITSKEGGATNGIKKRSIKDCVRRASARCLCAVAQRKIEHAMKIEDEVLPFKFLDYSVFAEKLCAGEPRAYKTPCKMSLNRIDLFWCITRLIQMKVRAWTYASGATSISRDTHSDILRLVMKKLILQPDARYPHTKASPSSCRTSEPSSAFERRPKRRHPSAFGGFGGGSTTTTRKKKTKKKKLKKNVSK